MADNYLDEKGVKKKSALKVVWLLVFFGIAFAVLLGKFALSGSLDNPFSGLPNSDAAYTVAKEFITPTVLNSGLKFSDSEYKFAKKSDSVYVIKSFYTANDATGDQVKTNFKITMKYNGGHGENSKNWTMLDLNQD